jgi:23S rRNA (uracil1939-C5)-methyltransferase
MAPGGGTSGPNGGASGGSDAPASTLSPMRRATLRTGEIPTTLVECEHAVECAGCPLIHLDYAQQLGAKRARVVAAATHYPALELLYTRPVNPAEPFTSYRSRAKLIVSPSGAIGLYSKSGNHEVVDIPRCRVLAPVLAEVASALRKLVRDPPSEARAILLPYDPLAGGLLRAVDLREVRDEAAPAGAVVGVLVTFVVQRDRAPSREELREAGRAVRALLPRVIGVSANLHEADAPQILGPETIALDGVAQAKDRIGATYHLASFGSFVQAHRDQAARVHTLIVSEIASLDLEDPPEGRAPGATVPPRPSQPPTSAKGQQAASTGRRPRVLDLYGGSGAISIALAHAKNAVTMVESFAPATVNARNAAESQGLTKLDVRCGDVAEETARLLARREHFDAILVNPPRRGVSPAARESIVRLGAPLIIYVSCDPDTLARDLDHWARLGYSTSELIPFDMIPLTEEVETVCVLRRTPPALPKVIYEDDDVVVVEKGPHEPVEPHPEYAGSLLARSMRLPAPGASFPVHRLDPNTSGLCILARNEEAQTLWSNALAANGRLIYLAATKGVTPAKGAITRDLREGGRAYPARTRYRRLAIASGHSVLRVIPDGGRSHQIRRHLAAIGHPILGDERYGHLPTNRYFEEKHGLDRTFIHLVRIEIQHPRTGARLLVESTLPGDLRSAIERATGSSVLRFLEQKHALGDQRASSIPPPLMPEEGTASEPSSSRAIDEPVDSSRISVFPITELHGGVPDLDEAPRTLRPEIVSDDEE